MTFTTPAAPVTVEELFPQLIGQARTTVRLHPRAGAPGPQDSSLGGPLLWPADEAWPVCPSADHEEIAEPVPVMVAVLQIFARDVPEIPYPEGTDVLQVIWCPGLHDDGYWPLPIVRWRDSASVTGPLLVAPVADEDAPEVNEEYVPQPCVLSPERVAEYPDGWEVGDEVRTLNEDKTRADGWNYFYHLGAAPGTKAGGWPDWMQDPEYPACDTCGKTMTHLVTIASWEQDGESWRRWAPIEDVPLDQRRGDAPAGAFAHHKDATLMLADAGSMYLLVCESCPDRPVKDVSQC